MQKDDFPILGIDHIHLYVGSAKQTAHYLRTAFGFTPVAYAGLETGRRFCVSYVLKQKDIHFIVTGALNPDSYIAQHVRTHGDGVKDIALRVPDCLKAYRHAVSCGARAIESPKILSDENGNVTQAIIGTYGETVHSLIERNRNGYCGPFLPGFVKMEAVPEDSTGLVAVDHVVGNVELGKMDYWASYYADVMGFTNLIHFDDNEISTEYSALMSKVMWDGVGKVKFPINEPAEGKKGKSQIQEYLDFYNGPGVQHIALQTSDIVKTVKELRGRGIEFLGPWPAAYYDEVRERLAGISDVDVQELSKLSILADRDEEGYLLQIFTKPLVDRPTLFFEIIERHGSRGFGIRNFKSLFEAIERDQKERGNL